MAHTETVTTYYDDHGNVIRREGTGGGFFLIIVTPLIMLFMAWSAAPSWVHWATFGLMGAAYLWGVIRYGWVRLVTYFLVGSTLLLMAAFLGFAVYAWSLHHSVHPDWQGLWTAVQTKILMHV